MHDVECPYCGKGVEINHDDGYGYDESKTHNQECSHCDKTFAYSTLISFDYDAWKADCLNGGEHKWKKTLTHPPCFARHICEDCGEERPHTDEEKKAIEEYFDSLRGSDAK
jgi:hypothetical protein